MSIQTTAVKQGDTYVLNGQKTFITNGIHADLIIVVCKTDFHAEKPHRVISLLLVNKDTPRFSKGRKLRKVGVHSQDTAELHFEDARVPASNLLGEEGKGIGYMMTNPQQERIMGLYGRIQDCETVQGYTVSSIFAGSNEIMKVIIAKQLG